MLNQTKRMLSDIDKHNDSLKEKRRRESKENIREDIERNLYNREKNPSHAFLSISAEDWERIFGK